LGDWVNVKYRTQFTWDVVYKLVAGTAN